VVDRELVKESSVIAISGPSTRNGASPFTWANWPEEPHFGLPETWNFDWNKFDEISMK
jgi:hypothetical protein